MSFDVPNRFECLFVLAYNQSRPVADDVRNNYEPVEQQHSTAWHDTVQRRTAEHGIAQYQIAQESTAQGHSGEHSIAQHIIAKHSTVG